ncbi:MarR family transcriptional regulator [Phycicoccus sp. CSK15P-2]|uniref:MarR family winged helix-turn-helix transcriptional regulator n=1 Tax=Phycicoccus sp. CSK15P-2 TaxID=2807627 RepID=UPI0027DE88F5|nr:MarR family transcriptional regulator [Phycicoccus sp. CSK15P-2]
MEEAPRWLTAEEQTSWRAYLRASRELSFALEKDLQCHGVSLSEYELLSMLSEADDGRLRMSALADLIVQSRSRVTHTATRLERRGWVERGPAPDDGRGVVVQLTDAGRQAVESFAVEHVESVRRHLVDVLTPAQLAALGEAMGAVHTAYRADPTTPEPSECPTMEL